MNPVIRPTWREVPLVSSRRASVMVTGGGSGDLSAAPSPLGPSRLCVADQHRGTLNIFGPNSYDEKPLLSVAARDRGTVTPRRHHNAQSTETREWPRVGLRRVGPVHHEEGAHGIRHLRNARGSQQNVQIVGITPEYKDPNRYPADSRGIRCNSSRTNCSSDIQAVLARQDPPPLHGGLEGEVIEIDLNAALPQAAKPGPIAITYSDQERFCVAVRNHVCGRSGGATSFYVNLARDLVAPPVDRVPADAATGVTRPHFSACQPSEETPEPARPVLTLRRCHDQLQALTRISISLWQLAEILWETDEDLLRFRDDEEALGALPVAYRDFSCAFAEASANPRLARMKL